jgi:hypothetical protein
MMTYKFSMPMGRGRKAALWLNAGQPKEHIAN